MKRKLNNRGFTLVEILAAMVLLSIVAFPFINTFLDSFKFQAKSQIRTEANKVMEYVAEQLKNEMYDTLNINEEDIEKWAKDENIKDLGAIQIDALPGSKLTAPYEVKIEKISSKEVQSGGIGTPDKYELKIRLECDAGGEIKDYYPEGNNNLHLNSQYKANNILDITKNIDPFNSETKDGKTTDFYAIFIDNKTGSPVTINVRKNFEDLVKIYTKGEITLNQVADPKLSRKEKYFERVPLGDNDEIKDEKEYLCEAKITAENLEDESIYSSMNATFSVFVGNES